MRLAIAVVLASLTSTALFVYGAQRPWIALPAGLVVLVAVAATSRRR